MKTFKEFLESEKSKAEIQAKLYEVILKDEYGVEIGSKFIVSMNTVNAVEQAYPEIPARQTTKVKFLDNVTVETDGEKSTVPGGADYGVPYKIGIDVERSIGNARVVIKKRIKDQEDARVKSEK